MKTFNYFAIFVLATLSVACNEQVSPKLLDANQSTTVPPVIEPEEYYFRVKNISPSVRKFHLHKSGAGNYDTPCEVKSPTKFNSGLYRDSSRRAEFDISCIFEAEELAMAEHGFDIEFEASANTCEYVAYAPFSFYNYKPGSSGATYTRVICEDGAGNTGVDASADSNLRPPTANGQYVGCGQMVLDETGPGNIPSTLALPFSAPESYDSLCRYNYDSVNGPKCDTGIIHIKEITYKTITEKDPVTDAEIVKVIGSPTGTKTVDCGGSVVACIDGPITTEPGGKGKASHITKYETVKNTPFVQTRKYGTPPFGPMYYVNFRRGLAHPEIDYGIQPETIMASYNNYINTFFNTVTNTGYTGFFPLLMENYAAGLTYDGLNDLPDLDAEDNITLGGFPTQKGIAHALEPFLGIALRTSPFYTFYCLDSASEIRARIKMVVRDWDRHFTTDRTQFDLVTDIYKAEHASMDNDIGVEHPGDGDVLNDLNDYQDWDDFLRMSRSPGPFDPSTTGYKPQQGFKHRDIWPMFRRQN